MDFGRLPSVDHIDFTLPENPARTAVLLNSKSSGNPFQLFVGCPIWSEKEWAGLIYPQHVKEKEQLSYYSRQFNCIELNSTYYRIPTPATIENWVKVVPSGFRFCPKFSQEISHTRSLQNCEDLTTAFCSIVQGFGEKLGICFLQLSPYFSMNQFPILENYLKHLPWDIRLAVEFRHETWFNDHKHFDRICQLLEERNIGTVITDTAGRRDVLHMRLTTSTAFIRFTANNLHPSDFPRIDAWTKRIREWKNEGLEEVYFFIHSPLHRDIPILSNYAVDAFNRELRTNLRPCRMQQNEQQELF